MCTLNTQRKTFRHGDSREMLRKRISNIEKVDDYIEYRVNYTQCSEADILFRNNNNKPNNRRTIMIFNLHPSKIPNYRTEKNYALRASKNSIY